MGVTQRGVRQVPEEGWRGRCNSAELGDYTGEAASKPDRPPPTAGGRVHAVATISPSAQQAVTVQGRGTKNTY